MQKVKPLLWTFAFSAALACPAPALADGETTRNVPVAMQQEPPRITEALRLNPTTVEVLFSNGQRLTLDFYGENIFRLFRDNFGGILRDPQAAVTEENTEAYTLRPTWKEVENADFYEIAFNGLTYSLLFEELDADTEYDFRIRAVNKEGHSEWTSFSATTKRNPLEFAIKGLTGECTAESQGRSLRRLFDFEEGELWHTEYGTKAVPFDLVVDLHSVNKLDKFHYIPRDNAGNGTLLKGSVSYSMDKENRTEAGDFEWKRDNETKVFPFENAPTARYIRLSVTEAVGNYGSGRELYVFKVPGTESYIPGDINNDKSVDENDLTSYINYTGLRQGDSDFDGYISNGDLNRNGLIDAYDISAVATRLNGGVKPEKADKAAGTVSIATAKRTYATGESSDSSRPSGKKPQAAKSR